MCYRYIFGAFVIRLSNNILSGNEANITFIKSTVQKQNIDAKQNTVQKQKTNIDSNNLRLRRCYLKNCVVANLTSLICVFAVL